jgi:hypothetical protein
MVFELDINEEMDGILTRHFRSRAHHADTIYFNLSQQSTMKKTSNEYLQGKNLHLLKIF